MASENQFKATHRRWRLAFLFCRYTELTRAADEVIKTALIERRDAITEKKMRA